MFFVSSVNFSYTSDLIQIMSLKDSCWLSKGNNMADADSLIFENTGTTVINDMYKDIKTDDVDPRHGCFKVSMLSRYYATRRPSM